MNLDIINHSLKFKSIPSKTFRFQVKYEPENDVVMFSAEDKETKEIWKGEPNVIELCGRFHTGAENVFDLLNEAFNEVHSDVYKECISLDGQFRDVNLNVLLSLDFHFGIKIQMNITLNPVKVDEVGRLTSLLLDSNEKIL